jgi:hypothetical protein
LTKYFSGELWVGQSAVAHRNNVAGTIPEQGPRSYCVMQHRAATCNNPMEGRKRARWMMVGEKWNHLNISITFNMLPAEKPEPGRDGLALAAVVLESILQFGWRKIS